MIPPERPDNEEERLLAVQSYDLVGSAPTPDYDEITSLAATICDVPISLITLLSKNTNYFKSHHGVDFSEGPRETSFCGHAILAKSDLFIVEDTQKDPTFRDNPMVLSKGLRFYAGAPLINPKGYRLGTLCIFDTKPRFLTKTQKTTLLTLANQVVNLLELHKRNDQLEVAEEELKLRNKRLEDFAGVVSHDLKSPLATITSLARLLKDEGGDQFTDETNTYLDYIEESTETLKKYINGMLSFYKSSETLTSSKEAFSAQSLYSELEDILFIDNTSFHHPKEEQTLHANKAALTQILINLIDNSLKYNSSDNPTVSLMLSEDDSFYTFEIVDNGVGISKEEQEVMFDLFRVTEEADRHGKRGSGIGLATVKKLVTQLGGTITVRSEKGQGATFTFTIKK